MRSLAASFRIRQWQSLPQKGIWFHAASIGETKSALPLLFKAWQSRLPFFVTNRSARALDSPFPVVDAIAERAAAPNELNAGTFLGRTNPRIGVFVESELWPVLIHRTSRRGVRLCLVNARLSESSFERWMSTSLSRAALSSTLRCFHLVHAQSGSDADRIQQALGEDKGDRILVGNLKRVVPTYMSMMTVQSREVIEPALLESKPGWAAISVHPGEYEEILRAQSRIISVLGAAAPTLVIVPRHPDQNRNRIERMNHINTIEINTIGVVEAVCEWASRGCGVVLVGGSLPSSHHHGGHNVIEPLAAGCSVLVGPHTDVFDEELARINEKDKTVVYSCDDIAASIIATCIRTACHPGDIQRRRGSVHSKEDIELTDLLWQRIIHGVYPTSN